MAQATTAPMLVLSLLVGLLFAVPVTAPYINTDYHGNKHYEVTGYGGFIGYTQRKYFPPMQVVISQQQRPEKYESKLIEELLDDIDRVFGEGCTINVPHTPNFTWVAKALIKAEGFMPMNTADLQE